MILADVNVLVHAFRKDSSQHHICKPWLDDVTGGEKRFGISPLALNAMVRVTTNYRVFEQPSSLEDAFGFCDDILAQPHAEIIEPGDRHWAIFRRLCTDTSTRGPRVTDAWFAALAIEHGCTWITFDRDFGRFPGLDWRAPAI